MTDRDKLRNAAQSQLAESPAQLAARTPAEVCAIVHELQVHQIELEMQNEELRRAHAELDATRERYFNLYDLAPVGYVTLSEQGLILESNLTAATLLGVTRSALVKKPLSRFILKEDQDIYHLSRTHLFETDLWQCCELRMVRMDASVFWARLESNVTRDASGVIVARFVLSDVTKARQLEDLCLMKDRVFDASMSANSIAARDGIITDANAAFVRIWGYASKEEAIGHGVAHFFTHLDEAMTILKTLDGAGHWQGEFNAKRKDGSVFQARGLATVMRDEQGNHVGYQSSVVDITAIKFTEDALQQSEEKYRKLHESMRDAFASVDLTGRITESNHAFQEMLGYTDAELRELTYVDITPPAWHADESRRLHEQVIPLGYSDTYEKEYRRKDGRVLPVELRAFLVRDAEGAPASVWAIIRDITERKQAEQALREWSSTLEQRVAERTLELQESETRFRQLAEATFEGIAVSADGILLDGNQRFAEIHGYALAEMIGRLVTDFIAPESQVLVAEQTRQHGDTIYEFVGLRKDGTVFPAEVHARRGTWMGKPMRISVLRDLTAAKQMAALLRDQQAELAHAQHLALVSEVSAGIIHQLGQPLSAIGANLSAMVKLKANELDQSGVLPIIHDVESDVARMRDIVVHLRALANPMQPNRLAVDVNALVTGVLPLLRQIAENHRIRLGVELGDDLPILQVDGVQVSQVIINLVRNAFDASKDCPLERRIVLVTTRADGADGVELSVRDAGSGIAAETISRLFSPFFSTKPDGLGVGLRLSQTIVQAHRGTIEGFNNPDGVGATFRIVLPATPPP